MIHPDIPIKAISIMQPWAWLIVNGYKDIENRDWATKYRGTVAIHAGKKLDRDADRDLWESRHPVTGEQSERTAGLMIPNQWELGGIVGVAEIINCVIEPHPASASPWFVGRYGFVIANARPVEFIPVKGALSFFDWRKNL